MLIQISEKVKKISQTTRKILFGTLTSIGAAVVAVSIIILFNIPTTQDPKVMAIHEEFLVQADELDHRIKLCNAQIDNMSLNYSDTAAFHCGMMWEQMKKFEALVVTLELKEPETATLVDRSMRTAERYAEYQKAINNLTSKPPHKLYQNL